MKQLIFSLFASASRLLCAMAVVASPVALAQTDGFPSRPITIVVPFAAGGSTDITARIVAEHLSKIIKQPVVVDNKPGASGAIGASYVLSRPADGYTLLFAISSKTTLKILQPSVAFDPMKDLRPVSMIAKVPFVLVIPASLGIKDFAGFRDLMNKDSSKVAWGFAGVGAAPHMAGTVLLRAMKADPIRVPYQGSALIHTDLIAGRVQMVFDSIAAIMPHINSGSVVPVAVVSQTRVKELPNVPTLKELGFSDFSEVRYEAWNGVDVPARTPDATVQYLNRALTEVLNSPEVKARIEQLGLDLFPPMSPSASNDFTVRVAERLAPLATEMAPR
jgi:tripartite-type tricarboxylate transporter receptor subunit TctC